MTTVQRGKATRIYCDTCLAPILSTGFDPSKHLRANVISGLRHAAILDVRRIVHTMHERTFHVAHNGPARGARRT